MLKQGGTTGFGRTRRATTALLATAVILTGTGGFAAAGDPAPAPAPVRAAPIDAAVATTLFTLTTMPTGWQTRTDLRPVLEVTADGKAVKRTPEGTEFSGTVPADVLSAAATEVRALVLEDLGTPNSGEAGNMIIDFMPAPPDEDVHVIMYDPALSEGLTEGQKASRQRFTALYDRLVNAFVRG